jgi:hypothetical protein
MCPVHHPGKNERRAADRLRLATHRLKIFVWDAATELDPHAGFGFVADLSPTGVGIFLEQGLPLGSQIRMGLQHVDGATYRGVVAWSQRYSLEQHFFGHQAHSYRVGVRCLFGSEAERQRYIAFQKEMSDRALRLFAGIKG